MTAEKVYIPKEQESKLINQFRPISLLNVEGKIFFSVMASRLTKYLTENGYINTSVQKGGIPGVSGCLEHATMIWEAIQRSTLPLLIDRLRDFFGLNSILHHDIKSSRRVNIRLVSSSLEQIMVVSSMNAFRGGIEHPPPRLAGPAPPTAVFNMTSMAITNSIGDFVHPIVIPTSRLIQLTV
ncbi:reverse transcriptase [Plakobranchus ocellatus]|uniref:Reverse transcriptase n=1 Tax=Plakobranchus ocellatus TaxID=259542 RepID=A0AAV3Z1F3_9GAST|nr:reverse transcriptase [Plakobranchus ocellatus]